MRGNVPVTVTGSAVESPEIPDPATATQKDVARLLARMQGSLDACNAQFPVGN